ncbi:BON domain-containing protein [Edaphobacter albus]|uniref:BON domain-containing protein n=1 Tax=Edaphobacter sp. 4G125 TaxID=2763071 RepID=UPI0016460DFE|nr:BON domain-containing protein [Edaphobacter sp. 4G125]QNI36178.1 BON domain-containing protein [Edaphobacter sp. 4G125]
MSIYALRISTRTFAAVTALSLGLALAGCKSTTPAAPAVDDASLTNAVQGRLSGDSALASEPIQAGVQNGIVTLNGTVSSEAARSLAAADAAQVSGIKTVVNNLSVQAPAPVAETPAPPPVMEPRSRRPAPKPVERQRSAPAPIERPQVAQTAPPPTPAPAPAPVPAPPPPPAFKNVTVPSGTTIPVRITQTLSSANAQVGQTFSGTVATDIMADGLVAIRQGTGVSGRVSAVQEAAHYKGNSLLSIELVSLDRRGDSLAVSTQPYSVEGKGRGKNTAAKVGGGAAIGAIIGAIAGGGKGAAIGSAAGAGIGAGANTVTRGEQVQIPSESLVNFSLTNTISIRVPTSDTLSTHGSGQRRRPMNPPSDDQQPQ